MSEGTVSSQPSPDSERRREDTASSTAAARSMSMSSTESHASSWSSVMAPAPLITLDQLEAWLSVDDIDIDRAAAVLDAVSSLLRSESGLGWEDTVPSDIQTVALQVAARVYLN